MNVKTEILERIEIDENGCWNWINKSESLNNYVTFKRLGEKYAHRVSYVVFKGDIKSGMNVCHACDNPKCVNPDHLFQGTQKENLDDMRNKNRHIFGEKHHGTILTEAIVKEIRNLYRSGKYTASYLSKKYKTNAYKLLIGETWNHVDGVLTVEEYEKISKNHKINRVPKAGIHDFPDGKMTIKEAAIFYGISYSCLSRKVLEKSHFHFIKNWKNNPRNKKAYNYGR